MKKKVIIIICVVLFILLLVGGGCYFFFNSQKYTVTFQDGSFQKEVVVSKGKLVDEIEIDDEHFLGWFDTNTDLKFDFSTKILKDYSLEARYKDAIAVHFDTDGGDKMKDEKVYLGDVLKEPSTPKKFAYQFVEWQLDGKKYDFQEKVTKEITLKAIWKESDEKIKVSFDSNGGGRIADVEVLINHPVAKPNNPYRRGYDFVEWQLNDKTYDFNEKVTKEITLKAKWNEKPKYKVSYVSDGVTVSTVTVIKGESIGSFPSDPSKAGHVFIGWFIGDNQISTNQIINGNTVINARYITVDQNNLNQVTNTINNSQYVMEKGDTNLVSQISNTNGCTVRSVNQPTSITREVQDRSIRVRFEVVCGGLTGSAEATVIIKASPYSYRKVANSNMLNYNVTVEGGNWMGDSKLFLGNGGSFSLNNRVAVVENAKVEGNPTFQMKFNQDASTIYMVPFRG